MSCKAFKVALLVVFSRNFRLILPSRHLLISWSRIVSSTFANSCVIAFCLSLKTNWSTFSCNCGSICLKTWRSRRRLISVQNSYPIAPQHLCSLLILPPDQRACNTNLELLVLRCAIREQPCDDLLQSLSPTLTKRTARLVDWCFVHSLHSQNFFPLCDISKIITPKIQLIPCSSPV